MNKKILYIPLDERPCNYEYPTYLANITSEFQIIRPDIEVLGYKKIPAKWPLLKDFIKKNIKNVEGIILSVDMLLYGGIVPSRLHGESKAQLSEKLDFLKEMKQINPEIKIFAYQLIMRCPSYSSDDEEPDYYQNFGKEIHQLGQLENKERLGILTEDEKIIRRNLIAYIPQEHLEDYLTRRAINLELIEKTIYFVRENIIDFMIIPQDDASVYGYTQMDQFKIRQLIENLNLELKVYMYPDADGVCTTLFVRFIHEFLRKKPKIFVRYSSVHGSMCIPFFEDRPVGETIKYHIIACSGLVASTLEDADLVAMINMVPSNMQSARIQFDRNRDYELNRNLVEFVEYIDYLVHDLKKPVLIGDCAYSGGGDYQLFKLLKQKGLLFKVHSYSGWNTCSNALSTTFSLGITAFHYGRNLEFYRFLSLRYVDDIFYQGIVRQESNHLAPTFENCSMWVYDGIRGKLSEFIRDRLHFYIQKELQNEEYEIHLEDSYQPWNRSYETCLKIGIKKKSE